MEHITLVVFNAHISQHSSSNSEDRRQDALAEWQPHHGAPHLWISMYTFTM